MPKSNREDPILVGWVLGEARIHRGLPLEELAERAGVSWESISDVEQGKELPPSQEWFTRVALSLGTTADGVLTRAEEMDEMTGARAKILYLAHYADYAHLRRLVEFAEKLVGDEPLEDQTT